MNFLKKARAFVPGKPLHPSLMFAVGLQPTRVVAFQVLHPKVGSWPNSQTLDMAGKAFRGQTL